MDLLFKKSKNKIPYYTIRGTAKSVFFVFALAVAIKKSQQHN